MQNARLDEAQAALKIAKRNINNLRYANQFSSVTQSCPTLCDPMDCSKPGFPVHHLIPELLKLMSIWSSVVHLIFCPSLLLPPSIFASIRVFSNEAILRIMWTKYWEFQLQHQSFQ